MAEARVGLAGEGAGETDAAGAAMDRLAETYRSGDVLGKGVKGTSIPAARRRSSACADMAGGSQRSGRCGVGAVGGREGGGAATSGSSCRATGSGVAGTVSGDAKGSLLATGNSAAAISGDMVSIFGSGSKGKVPAAANSALPASNGWLSVGSSCNGSCGSPFSNPASMRAGRLNGHTGIDPSLRGCSYIDMRCVGKGCGDPADGRYRPGASQDRILAWSQGRETV